MALAPEVHAVPQMQVQQLFYNAENLGLQLKAIMQLPPAQPSPSPIVIYATHGTATRGSQPSATDPTSYLQMPPVMESVHNIMAHAMLESDINLY